MGVGVGVVALVSPAQTRAYARPAHRDGSPRAVRSAALRFYEVIHYCLSGIFLLVLRRLFFWFSQEVLLMLSVTFRCFLFVAREDRPLFVFFCVGSRFRFF